MDSNIAMNYKHVIGNIKFYGLFNDDWRIDQPSGKKK